MDEIRCSFCGSINPANQELCQICRAQLKPSQVSPDSADFSDLDETPAFTDHNEASQGNLPEWLRQLRESELPLNDQQDHIQDFYSEDEKPDEIPDWFSNLRDTAGSPSEDEKPDEIPDWFSSLRDTAGEPDEAPVGFLEDQKPFDRGFDIDTPEGTGDNFPDWLKQASPHQGETGSYGSDVEVIQPASPEDKLAGDMPLASENGQGSSRIWPTDAAGDQAGVFLDESEGTGENVPDWLAEFELDDEQIEPAAYSEEMHVPPLTFDEEELQEFDFEEESSLPDWLADLDPAKQKVEGAPEDPGSSSEQGAEPDLEHAEIPGWIESIRPVSSVIDPLSALDEDHDEVVGAGPLAGLSGILPVEPGFPQAQKSPIYPLKVQITDAQQVHAGLLDQILRSEALAPQVPERRVTGSQNILRVVIALVLFVALPWAMVRGTAEASLSSFTQEIAAASQLIGEVQSGAPVLVAFDYEPGFTGEMDALAASVVDHLMLKGAYVTIVSTTPTGPIQAERLLTGLEKRFDHTYQAPGQYINLGFIPGGAAGLLSFVEAPRQTMPVALRGGPAWDADPLVNVHALSDFSLAMVITESPDTARAWIEQAQPSLETTPFIMVVSAQAEPMIRPYYESGSPQIQGLITGLSGGASYEELIGRNGLASSFRSPFAVGMLAAGVLVLLGGIINLAVGLLASRNVRAASEG